MDFRARCLGKDLESDGPLKLDAPRPIDTMVSIRRTCTNCFIAKWTMDRTYLVVRAVGTE